MKIRLLPKTNFWFARISCAALFVVMLLGSAVYKPANKGGVTGQHLNTDSLKQDFLLLYRLLTEVHPGSYMHCTPDELKHCYDSLYSTLSGNVTLNQFYEKTALLSARIKDGHTLVGKESVRKSVFLKKLLPFNVYAINNRFYVYKTGAKDFDSLIGKQLVSVNGKKIDAIVKRIKLSSSIEGTNESALTNCLQDFPLNYHLIDTSSRFTVEFSDTSNHITKMAIHGVAYKAFKLRTVKLVDPVSQEFIENKIAVLTLNTFSIEDLVYKEIDYKKYIDKFFSEVNDKEIQNLIIDVRGNGGGSPEFSSYLFSHLTDTTYYYFDYVGRKCKNPSEFKIACTTPDKLNDIDTVKLKKQDDLYIETEIKTKTKEKNYWWFDLQKGKKKCYKGQVYVLSNGGSFSTTGHFIALIKQYQRGQIYGECSQGSYYSNDAGLMFKLPYSGLEVRIPTAQFKMRLPGFVYDSKGICPDVEILKLPKDLKTGYDRQKDEVIRMISN
ncbi:MAG: S41 family peptidase [Flavobacteriales bacterium]